MRRNAFTLVEVMVVLLIIAILVSLVSSAVVRAMQKLPEVKTSTEIAQLVVAVEAFKQDYGLTDPPPSSLILNEYNPLGVGGPSAAFLQQAFGKNLGPTDWNGNGAIDGPAAPGWVLEGEQCLTFYLGGIPTTTNGPQGFSTNNMKPSYGSMLGEVPGKRHGPYFPFDLTRLKAGNGGFFVYVDPWQTKSGPFFQTLGGTPYAYFSSGARSNGYNLAPPGDCPSINAFPYFLTGTTQCMNPNGYQIISAGRDGVFGVIGWSPNNGAVGTGADDQANFSSTLLGSGQN